LLQLSKLALRASCVAAVATLAIAFPIAAGASPTQTIAMTAGSLSGPDLTINGRVVSANPWGMTITDDNGSTYQVAFVVATLTNPPAATIAPGMRLSVIGDANGGTLLARVIELRDALPYHNPDAVAIDETPLAPTITVSNDTSATTASADELAPMSATSGPKDSTSGVALTTTASPEAPPTAPGLQPSMLFMPSAQPFDSGG
jgi:hypothetical protein